MKIQINYSMNKRKSDEISEGKAVVRYDAKGKIEE